MLRASTLLAALISGIAATAQDTPTHHQLSLAAGYKAAFTCSATFNAGRTLDQITSGELARIYPDYRETLASLPDAVIDAEAKTVSVAFAEDLPPRIAAWRPHLGCAQLPPGADADMAALLPRLRFADEGNGPEPLPVAGGAHAAVEVQIQPIIDAAFDTAAYGDGPLTTAAVVVADGTIVGERYGDGFDARTSQRTWSVAKSIAATVIGAAVQEGLVEVDAAAPIPEWTSLGDPRSEITLANLLHMASGLDSGARGSRTDRVYFGGGRVKDNAAATSLEAAPGARWKYANNDTMLAVRALRGAMADDATFLGFPFEAVLHPLGMRDTYLETDWDGDFILSSQVWTTARDLARLGVLYLQDGVWDGRAHPAGGMGCFRSYARAGPARRRR